MSELLFMLGNTLVCKNYIVKFVIPNITHPK